MGDFSKPRATGVVIKDSRFLVMRRLNKGQEYFVFPGGGVEVGETSLEALVREMQEEVSLQINNPKEIFRMNDGKREHIFYLIKEFQGEVILGGEEKERMSEDDQYLPTWYRVEEFKKLTPFYPLGVVNIFLELNIFN